MRIALFTPFSPETGGGAAQLRSHLRYLPELDVRWYYLSSKPVAAPTDRWTWLGDRLRPDELLSDLSARTGFLPGSKARVREIVRQLDADVFWVVGHYEGICVAAELCDQGKQVHLTVHDDPFGTWRRSARYRMFQPLLRPAFRKLLSRVCGLDVTSWCMRDLYRQKYGVKCFAVYLHVPELRVLAGKPTAGQLTIGHIGTLYHPEPFRRFLAACKKLAAEQKQILRVVHIGASPEMEIIAQEHSGTFESHGDLNEEAAVSLLASCDLLYAMYPPGKKYELFRQTSLPIKLSTYVQAQRPIFAHSPVDSTLARIVGPYGVGGVCESQDENRIKQQIAALLTLPVGRDRFETLRNELMGLGQVKQLGAALRGEDWWRFGEYGFPLDRWRSEDGL